MAEPPCRMCGRTNVAGLDFCDYCGEPLPNQPRRRNEEPHWVECERAQPCDMDWSAMADSHSPTMRKCARCGELVILATTEAELERYRRANEFVAVPCGLALPVRKR